MTKMSIEEVEALFTPEIMERIVNRIMEMTGLKAQKNKHPEAKKSANMTLEKKRDEHVNWTKYAFGEKTAKKIEAIYNDAISKQSTTIPIVAQSNKHPDVSKCPKCGGLWGECLSGQKVCAGIATKTTE